MFHVTHVGGNEPDDDDDDLPARCFSLLLLVFFFSFSSLVRGKRHRTPKASPPFPLQLLQDAVGRELTHSPTCTPTPLSAPKNRMMRQFGSRDAVDMGGPGSREAGQSSRGWNSSPMIQMGRPGDR
jgi:hypothetical protein